MIVLTVVLVGGLLAGCALWGQAIWWERDR
jgi:hypothetical protein